jgi:DNA-binding NarL/FixJ family response regulator
MRLQLSELGIALAPPGQATNNATGRLTGREVEILRLVARGLWNKEIARRLGIAPKTVSNLVEHIYAKIGVSSRAAAALFATEHGLLTVTDEVRKPAPELVGG